MTIDEAIRLLQKDIEDPGSVDIMELNEAEELGIEALKRQKLIRGKKSTTLTYPLPRETKE